MRLVRAARAALTKSPRANAHSDRDTGPFAELATANRENARLRSELAAAKDAFLSLEAQLSAHLLNREATTSAGGGQPWAWPAPRCRFPMRTKPLSRLHVAGIGSRPAGATAGPCPSSGLDTPVSVGTGAADRAPNRATPHVNPLTDAVIALHLATHRPVLAHETRLLSHAAGGQHSPTPASPSRTR